MNSLVVMSVFAAAVMLRLVLRLWLIGRQIRHVARHRDTVPADFAGTVSLEAHRKAADYTIARQRLELLTTAWGSAVLLGWTLLGGLDALNILVREAVLPRWGDLAYQIALVMAVSVFLVPVLYPF